MSTQEHTMNAPAPGRGTPAEQRQTGEGAESAFTAMIRKRPVGTAPGPDTMQQPAQSPQGKQPKS